MVLSKRFLEVDKSIAWRMRLDKAKENAVASVL